MRVLSGRALPLRWVSRFPGALVNLVTTVLCQRSDFPAGNRACAHGAISILTSCSGRNSAPRRHYARILFFCTVPRVATTTLSCPRTSQHAPTWDHTTLLPAQSIYGPDENVRQRSEDPCHGHRDAAPAGIWGVIVPKSKKSGRHVPAIRGIGHGVTHTRSCGSCHVVTNIGGPRLGRVGTFWDTWGV